MPKIIDHLSEKLIAEARRQIIEIGYDNFNIRSVARNCGIGVGTVYNYFPSKDALVAAFMAEDWQVCLTRIRQDSTDLSSAIDAIYRELLHFHGQYEAVFQSAAPSMPAPPRQYHSILRSQLAKILLPWCREPFHAQFAAESLLTWSMAGVPLDQLKLLLEKALKG